MKRILSVILSVVFLSIIGYHAVNSEPYKYLSQVYKHVTAEGRAEGPPEDARQSCSFEDAKDAPDSYVRQADNGDAISEENLNSGLKNEIAFSSQEDALRFLLSKFTHKELEGFVNKTQDGISSEEFQEIMSCLFSRLSPGEYKALEAFVLSELGKKQISLSELRSIAALAQSGVTSDKMAEIKAALRISPEEYNKFEMVVLNELNKNNNN